MQSKKFTEQLNRLADVIVECSGVKENDFVLLHNYTDAKELAELVANRCAALGAKEIAHAELDPSTIQADLLKEQNGEDYTFPAEETALWKKVMDEDGVAIQLRTDFDPAMFTDQNEEFGRWYQKMWESRSDFFKRGVGDGEFAWTLVYIPNQVSAQRIYPELPKEEALSAYWDAVFTMTGCNTSDCVERCKANNRKLHERAEKLNQLEVQSLHFKNDYTDLTVGLSREASWLGGSKKTLGPSQREHIPNIPTYEVYSTPDWRTVSGQVKLTKTVVIDGARIVGGKLTFTNGRVTHVEADEGKGVLETLIKRDEGAAQLGEIALVGLDSPVALQNRVFESLLFDENAACHLALGNGYLAPIANGNKLSRDEKEALGVNMSGIHHDVMISNEQTNVTAATRNGKVVELIRDGHWTKDFQ